MAQAVRWQVLPHNSLDAVDPPKIERNTMTTYDLAQTANPGGARTRMRATVPFGSSLRIASGRDSGLCGGEISKIWMERSCQ